MSAPRTRAPRRRVDGVLLLDKPVGLSSNAALQHAKRLFAADKAGHTGTLDPLASGLLPLCFGEATKFAQSLLDANKTYVATVSFGTATDTGDAEGNVVATMPVACTREDIEGVLPRFIGTVKQVPPRHAALKHQGRAYYAYARAGIEIPRPARIITIDAIELLQWTSPSATLRVTCGKGTYVRVFAEDLGGALGTCAHLAALRRIATGPFALDHAVTLDALEHMGMEERDALLLPPHALLAPLKRLQVDAATSDCLSHGQVAPVPEATATGRYSCFGSGGRFIGLVEVARDGIRAVRLVRTQEERQA